MKRLKVLMSAYACESGKGSEPGVGWNMVIEMAKYHDIWVLTRANNRPVIEAEQTKNPVFGLNFVYYDLPNLTSWWKKGCRGIQLYYYLWQIGVYFIACRLHEQVEFDIVHHVTFGRYWTPSFLILLNLPFVWGSVGGGESIPRAFFQELTCRERLYELFRDSARLLGGIDPFVRLTARRANMVMATTSETAQRLSLIGTKKVRIEPQVAMTKNQIEQLASIPSIKDDIVKFLSIGRPLHWKGFYLGFRAFSLANIENAEYWLIADGHETKSLSDLSKKLEIEHKVRFIDRLPMLTDVYKILGQCHVLVHPALHEAFGNVILEAMAAGKPVICLDLGGPAMQVTDETGIRIPAQTPEQVVKDMAEAMRRLAEDASTRKNMGLAGRERVNREFTWEKKGLLLNQIYNEHVESKIH